MPVSPAFRSRWRPAVQAVLLGTAAALLAAGCTVGRPAAPPEPVVPIDASAFQEFVVPAPLLPFRVEGAVQFTYRGGRESGDLRLQALPGPAYGLELRARLTGGLALEVRFDRQRVLVIDYVNETYVMAANTEDTRRRLFDMDLTPEEFQTLLTGRVTQARFRAGGGVLGPDGRAEFHEDGAEQRFRLGPDGLPSEWIKVRDGAALFRVEFREYLSLPQGDGAPLRLPRKVRLYNGTAAADSNSASPALLALGVREFIPGAGTRRPPTTGALPPGAAAFVPGVLPDPPP